MTFKETVKVTVIPAIERMIISEQEHLKWLRTQKTSLLIEGFIYHSEELLVHLDQRLKQYQEYGSQKD